MAENPLKALVERLSSQAGSRGFTFAGRASRPGETIDDIMRRMPQGELETGGTLAEVLKAGIPLAMWKSMLPEAKAAVTHYANRFPVSFKKVLDDPQDLFVQITPNANLAAAGEFQSFGSKGGNLIVDPREVAGTVPIHELQHYLATRRVNQTNPVDAETIGTLLHEILPNKTDWDQGSLVNAINNLRSIGTQRGFAGTINDAKRFGPARWFELARTKHPERELGVQMAISNYGPQGRTTPSNLPDALRRLSMDEGLAYLAERSTDPQAPSLLKLLAARLGVLPE